MKDSTTDQVQGKLHELKGALKEKGGKMIDSPALEAEGKQEKVAGQVQQKVGEIKKILGK